MPAPSTSVLDTFTAGDGAGWNGAVWTFPVMTSDNALPEVLSNQGKNPSGSTWASAYRSDVATLVDCEAFATLGALGSGQQEIVELIVRMNSPGSSPNYYMFQWYNSGVFNLSKMIAGSDSVMSTTSPGPTRTIGDKVALQAIGSQITGWYFHSGVWTQIATVTDTSITTAGRIGLTIPPLSAIDDFGGGAPLLAQRARALSQDVIGTWLTDSDGNTGLAAKINESTASDTDYIKSGASPTTADISRFKLDSILPFDTSGTVTMKTRYKKNATGGDRIDLTVRLRELVGGVQTTRATRTYTNIDAITEDDYNLTSPEKASIVDWTALYIEFEAIKV